jgi:hypothetical protein
LVAAGSFYKYTVPTPWSPHQSRGNRKTMMSTKETPGGGGTGHGGPSTSHQPNSHKEVGTSLDSL